MLPLLPSALLSLLVTSFSQTAGTRPPHRADHPGTHPVQSPVLQQRVARKVGTLQPVWALLHNCWHDSLTDRGDDGLIKL